MKAIHCIIAAAALAFVQAAPASAGVNDPEIIIYRGSGVLDTGGGDHTGAGTAIHCTPFSGVTENVRFVVRNRVSTIVANVVMTIQHLNTGTVLTKATFIYDGTDMNTGPITQGTVAIAATSINVTCTAMQVDASAAGASSPQTAVLHMTRFNPIPATLE